jgi:N6-adenosine-specific RNA methylase IME4
MGEIRTTGCGPILMRQPRDPDDRHHQEADEFEDPLLRSWLEAPRGRHSEKPDEVRQLLERASPPPRIELFERKLVPGWYVWGNEVAERFETQLE